MNQLVLSPTTGLPDYAMFGTYQTEPKIVEFNCDGIRLTNVSPNKEGSRFKYHVMIPFIEMQQLFYCSDMTTNLLFIRPTLQSNKKIQESMGLGYDSWNGLKLDVESGDSNEHYIIVVLKRKFEETFLNRLSDWLKVIKPDIKINSIPIESGKQCLIASRVNYKCYHCGLTSLLLTGCSHCNQNLRTGSPSTSNTNRPALKIPVEKVTIEFVDYNEEEDN